MSSRCQVRVAGSDMVSRPVEAHSKQERHAPPNSGKSKSCTPQMIGPLLHGDIHVVDFIVNPTMKNSVLVNRSRNTTLEPSCDNMSCKELCIRGPLALV